MALKNFCYKNDNTIGQIFTPGYIAEFMVHNILKFIRSNGKESQSLRVLEPSAGKGIFLEFLLRNNFFNIKAYEMDYTLKEYLLKTYPNIQFKFDNFLGSNPNEKFDLIIGNPPYLGQNYNAETFQKYVRNFPLCEKYFVGNMDLFYYFIHLGIEKLNPGGFLSYITTNYWITKSQKTGIKFLKPHIINECYLLQYIDLSNLTLFKGAKGQHNCIFVLQKKDNKEKINRVNKSIEIVQVKKKNDSTLLNNLYNKKIFNELSAGINKNSRRYTSAINNYDLKKDKSWNLLYSQEIKKVVDKIEDHCKKNGKISLLNDYFLIRNGLILIKDEIFILKEDNRLKIENDNIFLRINGKFLKLNEDEKARLKKIYKSKSIRPYGYCTNDYQGFVIYFNRNEFENNNSELRNRKYETKYPNLTKYLLKYKSELRSILINAEENPENLYFPRRGSFIRKSNKKELIDLEPFYENSEKIFFKFILKDNIFGYSENPYYATSDTYFLWPKIPFSEIDYYFILAYLNSKIVNFLFKAKNISIKRSKTKIEHGLPIPFLKKFNSEKEQSIIALIRLLTSYLIKSNNILYQIEEIKLKNEIINLNYFSFFEISQLKAKIFDGMEKHDNILIQRVIDELIFQLFNLDMDEINILLEKYYE